ncbi:hypothetical protein INS49_013510 [Diaporthe citri]|uniref:uncharacterized protein n=1 Tax=Diaporthe citri TaxID=83186 RepID=UPI001C7EEF6F|nr:uncharacterized protein INS49_013510 [Diaporthe citri]KAG6357633.1 hypothetical protein INS49_013510 [Diaporthe citri]
MADTDDTVADDGQPIAITANTIAGPCPPQMAVDVVAHEGGETNNAEGTKDRNASQRTFKDPPAAQKSRLLTIAPEIRNMIFKLCLCHPEDIAGKMDLKLKEKNVETFSMASYYPRGVARPKLQEAYEFSISSSTKKSVKKHSLRNLALMRTCQTIYNEASLVFWGQRFTFRTILQLQNFLLSPHVRHDLVRDVKIWKMDYDIGVNYMPATCALLSDKLTGLEVFDVDMGHMRWEEFISRTRHDGGFQDDEHIKNAAKNLGFGIYSCMHPWVTKVVREQGIDKLMTILQIVRESDPIDPHGTTGGNKRVFFDFRGRGQLTASQRAMADAVTAEEIVRLVDGYEKNLF